MKKILTFLGVMALGFVLVSPALAGGRGHYRGHCGRVVHGGYHTAHYAPYYAPPRSRVSFFFGLGVPVVAAPPAYVYAPPPLVVEPVAYYPVWIPGYYGYRGGTRVFIAGHWSR
jgi:hypothetical protein